MGARENINRSIVILGTPLSIVTTLASIPLLLPITLPLIFLALVITLLLVLLALLAVLLILVVILFKQLPQLLQSQSQQQPQKTLEQSETQSKLEQHESKLHRHIRDSSTSTFSSRRRPMLHSPNPHPETKHHRTGSCHESEADTMVPASVYDFTTNGTSFGIDSPRKRH